MKETLRCSASMLLLAALASVSGCGSDDNPGAGDGGETGTRIASSTGVWFVYPDPYGDGGANPVPQAIMGKVEAFELADKKMRLALSVTGMPPNRAFGSHLHRTPCDDNKAGGHYQHNSFPDGGSATDPMYANGMNEAWLDFTTDANGAAAAETIVSWLPRAGEAKAVIIHTMTTGSGGVAGAKLACINIAF